MKEILISLQCLAKVAEYHIIGWLTLSRDAQVWIGTIIQLNNIRIMENSKGLKLVVLLVAMLAIWNTYSIETVDRGSILDFQSDSLEISDDAVYARIAFLEEAVAELQSTVMSQQSKIDRLLSSSPSVSRNTISPKKAESAASKPKVDVKVRVENRYVQQKAILPESKEGCIGVVVVEVKMNKLGMVGSATVASGTTITDEDVLYSCKEAALKTDFAYNPEAPETSIGAITYTFL